MVFGASSPRTPRGEEGGDGWLSPKAEFIIWFNNGSYLDETIGGREPGRASLKSAKLGNSSKPDDLDQVGDPSLDKPAEAVEFLLEC